MLNDDILLEINKYKYKKYIDNHIVNVQISFLKFKEIFKDQDFCREPELFKQLETNIKMHDNSKYGPEEFDAYRANFNPINNKEKENNKEKFDKAWEHHYTINLHHWNHWYNKEDGTCEKMPSIYIAEMIIDWMAMGLVFGNSAYEYYFKNKNDIHLHDETRFRVEYLLNKLNKEDL